MSQVIEEIQNIGERRANPATRLDGVVIGLLTGFNGSGLPLVVFAANPQSEGIPARSTVNLGSENIGKEVALLFENGDPKQPLVIGRIQHPEEIIEPVADEPKSVELDGKRLLLTANQEITLRCGKASITLTKAGKILLRGAYVLSRSSGVNRIKGGAVQIN